MKISVFVAGYGQIGRPLVQAIQKEGWEVGYIATSSDVYTIDAADRIWPIRARDKTDHDFDHLDLRSINVAFIATPPSEGGWSADIIARQFIRRHIPVVTCDKSLIVNYPHYLSHMGCSATVGGGSGILPFLRRHARGRTDIEAHFNVNGSLNFIMDSDRPVNKSIRDAGRLGYMEPGAQVSPTDARRREIQDVLNKTEIVFYDSFATKLEDCKSALAPYGMRVRKLEIRDLNWLSERRKKCRYIVSFRRDSQFDEEPGPGSFSFETSNGWLVSGGFKLLDDRPLFAALAVSGPDNAAIIKKAGLDRGSFISGPGAGPIATVDAMIRDAKDLLSIR